MSKFFCFSLIDKIELEGLKFEKFDFLDIFLLVEVVFTNIIVVFTGRGDFCHFTRSHSVFTQRELEPGSELDPGSVKFLFFIENILRLLK